MKKIIFHLCFALQILKCFCVDDIAKSYLTKYAYLGAQSKNPQLSSLTDASQLVNAIKDFQRIAGLPITGELDEDTKKVMDLPRCGMPDYIQAGSYIKRRRRYAVFGTKWPKSRLTYNIKNYSPDMKKDDIERTIQKALEYWQNVSKLTFEKSRTSSADIQISFERGSHGDSDKFDGPGGTLAHAFFPTTDLIGGDAHFDEDERWTIGAYDGTNLLQVAVHEFGHSLGLSHSDVKESIMAPFYRGYEPNMVLHADDIRGIQTIYGPPTEKEKTPTTPPPTKTGICSIDKVDAVFSFNKQILLFKGDKLYLLNKLHDSRNVQEGLASTFFYKFPGNIDAAIYRPINNGLVYLFKGSEVWRYSFSRIKSNFNLDIGFPRLISIAFPKVPSNLDAAYQQTTNGKMYFFKGDEYYRYSDTWKKVASDYPKKISLFNGIPPNISAALCYPSDSVPYDTYFFKNSYVYKYNDESGKVERGFPRPLSWFLGCPDTSNYNSDMLILTSPGNLPRPFSLWPVALVALTLRIYY